MYDRKVEICSELELDYDWLFLSHGEDVCPFSTRRNFCCTTEREVHVETTTLRHGSSVPSLLTKRLLFVWAVTSGVSVPIECHDVLSLHIYDVMIKMILLRRAFRSLARTFSTFVNLSGYVSWWVRGGRRYTHGRSRDHWIRTTILDEKMSREFT